MLSNRLAVVVVGGACVLAAGTGAYVATRQDAPQPAAVTRTDASAEAPAAAAVHETEAVMDPAPPKALTEADAPTPPRVRPEADSRAATPVTGRPASRESPRPPAERRTSRTEPRQPDSVVSRRTELPAPTAPMESEPEPEVVNTPRHVEPPQPLSPPRPTFEELTIPSDSVIGLEIEGAVSTETAEVEDRVEARVTRDVLADGRVAIPAGARALGNVTLVERGGKVKERARLAVRFHTLVLGDGTNVSIQTDTLYREGDSPARASAAKIGGGAVGGAIVGAILGGAKGAVIGGSAGAAGGTAATMAGKRRAATLPAGSTVTVRVLSPVQVTVER